MMRFDLPNNQGSPIKVIGVGGGGSNAVNYMHEQGINGVDFIVCNTDNQALDASSVPVRIQLGKTLTAASNHYNDTVTALVGNQGLHGKVERFKTMSAKASKDLPAMEPLHPGLDDERLDLALAPPADSSRDTDNDDADDTAGGRSAEISRADGQA